MKSKIIIDKNLKVGQGRTQNVKDFINAVNTWEGLEALWIRQITPKAMEKILIESDMEHIILIRRKKWI